MPAIFRNNAASVLAAQAQISDTTISITTGTGNRFPAPTANEWFFATIQSGVNYEIVKCTARAGDVLTVVRAQDGTSAQLWNAGTSIDLRIPKVVLESFLQQGEIARVAAGSAATPSLTFTGDPDTGIFNPGPDEIGFLTAGAEKLRLDSLGNVGIGTTGPSSKLEVVGSITTRGAVPEVKYLETGTGTVIRTLVDGSAWDVRRNDYSVLLSVKNSNGQIQAGQPGTVAAPAYSFSGDPDTGFYNVAGDSIGVSSGGSQIGIFERNQWFVFGSSAQAASFFYLINTGASASQQRSFDVTALNEGFAPLTTLRSIIGTDGSGNLEVLATPAGSRASDRRVNRMTIPGSGPISLTGDVDVAGNLRFNSGYGSAAIAYGVRAWVNFNGTGTVAIRGSGGVTSITDNGVGDYTVNFNFTMPDANYAPVITVSASGAGEFGGVNTTEAASIASITTTSFRFACKYSYSIFSGGATSGRFDPSIVSAIVVR